MIVQCGHCKNEIKRSPSRVKKAKISFCNQKCHNLFQKNTIFKICKICKIEFEVRPCEQHKFVTCSKESCRNANKLKENNPNWRGGIAKSRKTEMSRKPYKEWRRLVFERDGFKCVECKTQEGRLNADHILPWAAFPEIRYDVNNGRTLCEKCHRKTYKDNFMHIHWRRQLDNPAIYVDLDKTLAYHESEWGVEKIGEPIPAMFERVCQWVKEGKRIKIFTVRACHGKWQIKMVQDWLVKHGLPAFEVTNIKKFDMSELWDDRGVRVERNTGKQISDSIYEPLTAKEI